MCEKHNGYTNYQTWAISLWLDNDCHTYSFWLGRAKELLAENAETAKTWLAKEIQERLSESNPLIENASVYSDLLQSTLNKVNWYEVAESFVTVAQEELELDVERLLWTG